MTPELQSALERIDRLEAVLSSLARSSTIPRDIETAFAARLGTGTALISTGTGSAAGTSSYAAFPVVVPANPSGTVKVTIGTTPYELLLK